MKKIYIIRSGEYYKVGISQNVLKRLDAMQTGNPVELEVISIYTTNNPLLCEAIIHDRLKQHYVRGEWFSCDTGTIGSTIDEVISGDVTPYEDEEAEIIRLGLKLLGKNRYKRALVRMSREHRNGDVEIDKYVLKGIMTGGCGMPKWKAKMLGLSYPLKRGWKKKLIGRKISSDTHSLLVKAALEEPILKQRS